MVTFITGPMFSFKTSTLFTRIERHYFAMCTDIIRLLGERAMFVTRVLSEKKIEVLKDLQANGFMAVESSED